MNPDKTKPNLCWSRRPLAGSRRPAGNPRVGVCGRRAGAAQHKRWVKNKDDKRQALTNERAAVGDQAAEDMRASRIIDPHDKGPAGTAARAGVTPASPVRSTDSGLASTAWRWRRRG